MKLLPIVSTVALGTCIALRYIYERDNKIGCSDHTTVHCESPFNYIFMGFVGFGAFSAIVLTRCSKWGISMFAVGAFFALTTQFLRFLAVSGGYNFCSANYPYHADPVYNQCFPNWTSTVEFILFVLWVCSISYEYRNDDWPFCEQYCCPPRRRRQQPTQHTPLLPDAPVSYSILVDKVSSDCETCIICLEKHPMSLLQPCNHVNTCEQCTRKLYQTTRKCPTCRCHIQSFQVADDKTSK